MIKLHWLQVVILVPCIFGLGWNGSMLYQHHKTYIEPVPVIVNKPICFMSGRYWPVHPDGTCHKEDSYG